MKQRADLTFKENLLRGRHGWLRLTPAFSVKVVHQILVELLADNTGDPKELLRKVHPLAESRILMAGSYWGVTAEEGKNVGG